MDFMDMGIGGLATCGSLWQRKPIPLARIALVLEADILEFQRLRYGQGPQARHIQEYEKNMKII